MHPTLQRSGSATDCTVVVCLCVLTTTMPTRAQWSAKSEDSYLKVLVCMRAERCAWAVLRCAAVCACARTILTCAHTEAQKGQHANANAGRGRTVRLNVPRSPRGRISLHVPRIIQQHYTPNRLPPLLSPTQPGGQLICRPPKMWI
mgnify:CR=1 FL=1|jgi:hypothetical protein